MVIQFKDANYCINYDWLQFSVIRSNPMESLNTPEGFQLKFYQGNQVFRNRAILFDKAGRKWLTFLWAPYSAVLDEALMTVQLSNELLYQGSLAAIMDVVQQVTPCQFNSIGRLDVCLDFVATDKQLKLIDGLSKGKFYVQGKHECAIWAHQRNENGFNNMEAHCINWGNKTSKIKTKLYNKSREQGLVDGKTPSKPWIVSEWERAGFNKGRVWRLEFSLTSACSLRWNNEKITLETLETENWLEGIYFQLFEDRFVTRKNEGKKTKEHNRDERVYLLELPKDGEKLTWKKSAKSGIEPNPAVSLVRGLLRQLENTYVSVNLETFDMLANVITSTVKTAGLEEYFERYLKMPISDYLSQQRQQCGLGVVNYVFPPSKFID